MASPNGPDNGLWMPGTPTTLLFIAANPATTTRLALDEEARLIEQELGTSASQGTFRIRALWAARPIELLRGLNHDKPAIVHFAGHADGHGLMLADDEDGHVAVSGANLSRLLGGMFGVTRLVVLNACLTDEQSQALVNAAGCVIAMQSPISDVGARRFSQGLYAALAQGQSVYSAFEQAIALLAIHRRSASDTRDVAIGGEDASVRDAEPILRTRTGVDARSLCFLREESARVPASPWWRRRGVPSKVIAVLGLTLAVALVSRLDEPGALAPTANELHMPTQRMIQPPEGIQPELKPGASLWQGDPDCNLVRINEISTRAEGLTLIIDLTMHDIGNRVANVTRINMIKEDIVLHSVQSSSATYVLPWILDSNELFISHVMRPDEVDRITVRVHLNRSYAGKSITVALSLKYNRTCQTPWEHLRFTAP